MFRFMGTLRKISAPQILEGRRYLRERVHAPYQVLHHLEPGLMIDAGAASGYTSSMMIRMSPGSTVLAFEPFPGNHAFFEAHIEGDRRVTLDKRAVSDAAGRTSFIVPATVTGAEPGWEKMKGYSSLGMLGSPRRDMMSIEVETCRLDEVVSSHVRFLKIDTQGAELKVLRGCSRLFARKMIDIMHVEFDGREDVMAEIIAAGFTIMDTECIVVNEPGAQLDEWNVVRNSTLSTGKTVAVAWPRNHISDPRQYCRFLRTQRRKVGLVWTDLLCIRHDYVPEFMFAAGRRDMEVGPTFGFSMKKKISAA